ncbi:MAG: hypothetical protein IBX71_07610 [Candidatus Desulforudis sp.]|nr:hypothetical protein [Desulforudis sp.]
MIVLIISALKRKVLFAFRLFLLVIIMTVLVIQIYGIFKTGAAPPPNPVPVLETGRSEFPGNIINWLKDYYRGNLR